MTFPTIVMHAELTKRKGIEVGPRFKGPVARVKWTPRCRNYRRNETTANNATNTA